MLDCTVLEHVKLQGSQCILSRQLNWVLHILPRPVSQPEVRVMYIFKSYLDLVMFDSVGLGYINLG